MLEVGEKGHDVCHKSLVEVDETVVNPLIPAIQSETFRDDAAPRRLRGGRRFLHESLPGGERTGRFRREPAVNQE